MFPGYFCPFTSHSRHCSVHTHFAFSLGQSHDPSQLQLHGSHSQQSSLKLNVDLPGYFLPFTAHSKHWSVQIHFPFLAGQSQDPSQLQVHGSYTMHSVVCVNVDLPGYLLFPTSHSLQTLSQTHFPLFDAHLHDPSHLHLQSDHSMQLFRYVNGASGL